MLEYLCQLPYEALGQKMFSFLELIDIIQFENAATSQESQQLLRAILPYCTTIVVSDSWNRVKFNHIVCNWFSNRRCRVQFMRIPIESLCEVNFEHSVLYDITLGLKTKASLKDIASLNSPSIRDRISKLQIECEQNPAVMEVLFSLLTNSSVRSLIIKFSNLSQWMEHIKQIGPCLREFTINYVSTEVTQLTTITEFCPYLEKLSSDYWLKGSQHKFLQSIARNCPYLRSITIWLNYSSSTEAEADLTAFTEKCSQLEELSQQCRQLTDQFVIALAQHCSRLKKWELNGGTYTGASLIALSERALSLEELVIPRIPILSAEIAAQCAHALSRIRWLSTHRTYGSVEDVRYVLQYMTGLCQLCLYSSEDHLLMPHLLLLLHGQCCVGLESLTIGSESSITPKQLCELAAVSVQLCTLTIYMPSSISGAVLVELARSCPHLQKISLDNRCKVTEEAVLALAAHCRQLREIHIPYTTVTEETVRELAQHCRHLTELRVTVREGEVMAHQTCKYNSTEIRALR